MDYVYINPNAELIRTLSSDKQPDWKAFRKSQEPHARAYAEMLREWEKTYTNPLASMAEREQAGINLGYRSLRIEVHEILGRIFGKFKHNH